MADGDTAAVRRGEAGDEALAELTRMTLSHLSH